MNENKKGVRAPKRTQKAKGLEIAASKPRNFVAKNATKGGAGAHKDKAKTIPRKAKHKKAEVAESLEARLARALQEVTINEEGLSPMKRLQIIRFIASEKGWDISDLELASDSELIHMYKKIKAGEEVAEGGDDLDKYSLDQLQGYYSDFNKDLLGFRPRGASEEQWNDPEWLKNQINGLHNYFDKLKSTPEGRAKLQADGWDIKDEVDEAGYGRNKGYHQGFASPTAPRLGRGREDDEYHNGGDYDPELERNRKETMMYNVTVNGKPVTPKPLFGRSAAIAWAKEQIAAGKLDPKEAKLSPVQYNEGWTHDTLAARLFEQDHTYEDRLTRMLAGKVAFMEGNEPVIMMSKDAGHHEDHEVKMAREESYHAAKVAFELHKLLQGIDEAEGLPGWVSEKISLAYDYLKTVQEYLDYEHEEPPTEIGDTGDE